VTLDLSYLSLTAAVPQAAPLLAPEGDILALFKPLFEVEDPEAGRTGRVSDPALIVAALRRVLEAGVSAGLTSLGAAKLALQPRHGVTELFVYFTTDASRPHWEYDDAVLAAIVENTGIGRQMEDEEASRWARKNP
jgi:23S rRNA (cytidine1920-2'-O)/16S rRNA (cytidine1409-2'-O)-methyltransferase